MKEKKTPLFLSIVVSQFFIWLVGGFIDIIRVLFISLTENINFGKFTEKSVVFKRKAAQILPYVFLILILSILVYINDHVGEYYIGTGFKVFFFFAYLIFFSILSMISLVYCATLLLHRFLIQ